jgi:hypothetical protein
MPDAKTEKAKGKVGVLRLRRETLRELDAGELKHAQGGGPRTAACWTEMPCTRGCNSRKKC